MAWDGLEDGAMSDDADRIKILRTLLGAHWDNDSVSREDDAMTTDRKPNALGVMIFLALVSAVYVGIGVFVGWCLWGWR